MKNIACIILAAGLSSRFGSLKQTAIISSSGKALLQNSIDVANGSSARIVIVVLGWRAELISAKLSPGRAKVVINENYQSGLSSSIISSLRKIPRDIDAAIFVVADQPNLTTEHLDRLIQSYYKARESRLVLVAASSTIDGEIRNPVLIGRQLFPELLKLKGDSGAKEIVRKHTENTVLVRAEPKLFTDIDIPSDIE